MLSEPRFYLKDNKADVKTTIVLFLKVKTKPFKYSIQKTIEPPLWDRITQRPTKAKEVITEYKKHVPSIKDDLRNINNRINNVYSDVKTFLYQVEQENRVLDFKELRAFLDSKYKEVITPIKQEKTSQLNNYIKDFLIGIEEGSVTIDSGSNHGKKYKDSTVKTWKEWYTQFVTFQSQSRILKWEDIDLDIYHDYITYFYDKNYTINSVGKHIKHLKSILKRALNDNLHQNLIYTHPSFRTLNEDVENVVLTSSEVEMINDYDASESKRLQLNKDVFIIGCFTALRLSDIKRIDKSHITKINERNFISINTTKTGSKAIIPIGSKLDTILKKYDYTIPKITEQYLREDIKSICRDVGIDSIIEFKSSKGGRVSNVKEPKYKLVSSHTARRTGATNMHLDGIPTLDIMKITTHKKESTFLRYINVSGEQSAETIAGYAFFK
jgi:integrase